MPHTYCRTPPRTCSAGTSPPTNNAASHRARATPAVEFAAGDRRPQDQCLIAAAASPDRSRRTPPHTAAARRRRSHPDRGSARPDRLPRDGSDRVDDHPPLDVAAADHGQQDGAAEIESIDITPMPISSTPRIADSRPRKVSQLKIATSLCGGRRLGGGVGPPRVRARRTAATTAASGTVHHQRGREMTQRWSQIWHVGGGNVGHSTGTSAACCRSSRAGVRSATYRQRTAVIEGSGRPTRQLAAASGAVRAGARREREHGGEQDDEIEAQPHHYAEVESSGVIRHGIRRSGFDLWRRAGDVGLRSSASAAARSRGRLHKRRRPCAVAAVVARGLHGISAMRPSSMRCTFCATRSRCW